MFTFWARLVLAVILGSIGYFAASPLAVLFELSETSLKISLALTGAAVGFISFSQIASWIIKTVTMLIRQFISKIASETINQFTHLTAAGLTLLPKDREEKNGIKLSNPIILDTSAIIDGRILDIAKTGFLSGIIMVPDFILTELQQVADSADDQKRQRGRKGFATIEELRKTPGVNFQVWDKDLSGKTVDDRLLRLGRILKGKVVTCDFNLNRVASVTGVQVLNVNELANALKTVAVPGEKLHIKIIQLGKDKSQGVGYLNDGTMVVVKDAADLIGKSVDAEVTRMLQIPAGRMIFAKLA